MADGLDAERPGSPAAFVADLTEQGERPRAARLAGEAGTLMQQQVELLVVAGVEQGLGGLGPGGLLGQASQPLGVEGGNRVAHRASGAAQVGSDAPGPLAGGAGQEDLAAAQAEGVGRTQAGLQLLPLVGSQ